MRDRLENLTTAIIAAMALTGCFLSTSSDAFAEPPRGVDCAANELLPSTIIACAEFPNLGGALQTVLNHPLRAKLEAMPSYDSFMQSGGPAQLQMGVRAFEASMGKPWQEALDTLTDRGITVALDTADGGIAVLVHSSDEALLERFRGFVLALRQMQGATAKQGDYRGFVADMWDAPISCTRRYERLGWGIGIGDLQCCWSEAVGRTEAALRNANSDGVR